MFQIHATPITTDMNRHGGLPFHEGQLQVQSRAVPPQPPAAVGGMAGRRRLPRIGEEEAPGGGREEERDVVDDLRDRSSIGIRGPRREALRPRPRGAGPPLGGEGEETFRSRSGSFRAETRRAVARGHLEVPRGDEMRRNGPRTGLPMIRNKDPDSLYSSDS